MSCECQNNSEIITGITRGTEPQITFTLPFDADGITSARIILAQNSNVIAIKKDNEIIAEGKAVSCRLSQEETIELSASELAQLQLRYKTSENIAMATAIIEFPVFEILDDEVI